jgi:hypothetical protein
MTEDDLPPADASPRPCRSAGSPTLTGADEVMVVDAAVESYCRHLMNTGDNSRARRIAESIRATRSAALGPEHPATITAGDLLGEALVRLEKTAEFRQLAEEMLELCRHARGADDPAAMRWQKMLVDALRQVSEVRASVELAEDLLDRCRRLLGDGHETTLKTAASLVITMIEDRDYEAARSVAEDLWHWRTQAQGPNHADTLRAACLLIFVTSLGLAGFRERQQAGRLALDTLTRSERTNGYLHPRTAEVKRLIRDMRGFVGTYDPIGTAYARVSGDDLSEAAGDCAPFSFLFVVQASGIEPAALKDPARAGGVFRDANERILEQLRQLVARNDPFTILRCARRVPRELIRQFLEQVPGMSLDEDALETINVEFPMLAANVALDGLPAHGSGRPPRTTATLLDGVRMALLCALHRSHTYYLNTAVRWRASGSAMETGPIESYVRRSQRAGNVVADALAYARAGNGAGITGLSTRRQFGRTTIRLTASRELGEQHLTLNNYWPITIPPERDRQWTGYLSHPSAAPHLGGLPFDRWWRCWLALNLVARSWIQHYLLPASSDAANPAEQERLRLFSEAQNIGMIEVDRDRLRNAVLHEQIRDHPSRDEYDAFVASLTWRPGMQKPEFVESPAIFYPSGDRTMFWDLLRHGGVLPGLARRLSRKRGGLGERIGKYFEDRVHAALSEHPAVTQLRSDVSLPSGTGSQDGIQIDHGFVSGNLLVLVESKSFIKTAGYLVAHETGFKVRAERIQEVLPGRDQKLRELRDQIALAWEPAAPRQALYVVCTTEVEYIPSEDRQYWLDRSRDIPRVCTLRELLEWLDDLDPATMAAHPGCIPLT